MIPSPFASALEIEDDSGPQISMMPLLRFGTLMCCSILLQSPNLTVQLKQSEIVEFGKLGKIRIEAWGPTEELLATPNTDLPSLTFRRGEDGQLLETISIDNLRVYNPIRVRFRVLHIEGLPDPLILAIANTNGGSDCYYYPIPIARVNGRFRKLFSQTPEMDTQGAFSLGPLGKKGGIGLAVSTFQWGPNESHYDRHRYRIKFYRWNKAQKILEFAGSQLTPKLDDGAKAAVIAGIDSDIVMDAATLQSWFPEYSC